MRSAWGWGWRVPFLDSSTTTISTSSPSLRMNWVIHQPSHQGFFPPQVKSNKTDFDSLQVNSTSCPRQYQVLRLLQESSINWWIRRGEQRKLCYRLQRHKKYREFLCVFIWEMNPKGPHLFVITNTWEVRVGEVCNKGIILGSFVKSVSFWWDLGSYLSSNWRLDGFHRKEMKCWQLCDRPLALSVPFDLIRTAGRSGMATYIESK